MKKSVLILIIILNFACKNKTKKEAEEIKSNTTQIIEDVKNIEVEDVLKIHLIVRILENDKFRVFYTSNSPEEKISEKKMEVASVKGNSDFQQVTIQLPKGVVPYKLRLDLGENSIKNQSDIDLESINIELNDNVIKVDNQNIKSYFRPNQYLTKTPTGYSRKIVDDKYDPFLLSTSTLIEKIVEEL